MANGVVKPSPEQPARIEALHKGATAAGCSFAAPGDAGTAPIAVASSARTAGAAIPELLRKQNPPARSAKA